MSERFARSKRDSRPDIELQSSDFQIESDPNMISNRNEISWTRFRSAQRNTLVITALGCFMLGFGLSSYFSSCDTDEKLKNSLNNKDGDVSCPADSAQTAVLISERRLKGPLKWHCLPEDIADLYTLDGKIGRVDIFLDGDKGSGQERLTWTAAMVPSNL